MSRKRLDGAEIAVRVEEIEAAWVNGVGYIGVPARQAGAYPRTTSAGHSACTGSATASLSIVLCFCGEGLDRFGKLLGFEPAYFFICWLFL